MADKAVTQHGKRLSRGTLQSLSAKKRRKMQLDAASQRARIRIGFEVGRWMDLKSRHELATHEEVAKLLLDSYEKTSQDSSHATILNVQPSTSGLTNLPRQTSSTPMDKATKPLIFPDSLSEISEERSAESEGMMSGIDYMLPAKRTSQEKTMKCYTDFIDPFDLTISASDDVDHGDSGTPDEDPHYEPSFNIDIGPRNVGDLQETSFADLEFGDPEGDEHEEYEDEQEAEDLGPEIRRVLAKEDLHHATEDETFIVYRSCLMSLASRKFESFCKVKGCTLPLEIKSSVLGSALYLKWICPNRHKRYIWCSQPVLNGRLHGGDLLTAFAVLASGNNYAKVALFAKFLKLHFIGRTTFSKIQRCYLVPVINDYWEEHQKQLIEQLEGKEVVVAGDGRMDSPGHCAQYCTYSTMDYASSKIISIVSVDKRETGGKSSVMEKVGFERSLRELTAKKVAVVEVVTDEHMQIGALMRKTFTNMKHSYDVWHVAKNLGKKINAIGQDKDSRHLLKWTSDITNHFWHSCKVANTIHEFRGVWLGTVHHVVNEHQWALSYGNDMTACSHGALADLTTDKWLRKGSPAHQALNKLAFEKRLLNKIPYLLNFRSTAQLENFNQLVLMYAGKRFAYSPPVYKARCQLAALDHNKHIERAVLKNKDGQPRMHRVYNKKSNRWTVVHVKEPKEYSYIFELLEKVVIRRLEDESGMRGRQVLTADDPRRISGTIASQPPPPTSELISAKSSRL